VNTVAIDDTHHARIKAFEPSQATPDDELKAWKHVAFKTNRLFDAHWLYGDIGDNLHEAVAAYRKDKDNDALARAFDSAQESINKYFKRLSATRINYESDFQELMKRALADNHFGRVQWASAVRSLNRRYITSRPVNRVRGKSRIVFYDDAVRPGWRIARLLEIDDRHRTVLRQCRRCHSGAARNGNQSGD
jgi:hypothetical protein